MTHSQIKPANFNGKIIDTECIIGQNNSDITTCTQESETNMISAFSLVRNDSCYNTVKCPENIPEAQNSSNIHGSLSDSNMHGSLSESTIHRCASCNHIPQNLSQELWFTRKGIHIMHLNIHDLYSKFDELKALLSHQNNIDILCICETFLNDTFSDTELQLENYQLFRKDRKTNGGGLVIYVKENLRCSLREDLQVHDIEALWVEIKHESQKVFLLGYTYRPPSSHQKWTTDFEVVLEQVYTENKEIILLGDLNLNLLESNSHVHNWLQTTESINLNQLVHTPTRVAYLFNCTTVGRASD